MINASNEGICLEFWREKNTTLVYLLSYCITRPTVIFLCVVVFGGGWGRGMVNLIKNMTSLILLNFSTFNDGVFEIAFLLY